MKLPTLLTEACKEYIDDRGSYRGPKMSELTDLLDLLAKNVFASIGYKWTDYNHSQFEKLACEYPAFHGVTAFCMNSLLSECADCYQTLHVGNREGTFPLRIWASHIDQKTLLHTCLRDMTPYGTDGVD